MSRKNPISEILKARRWTSERAAREIYEAYKEEFISRGTVWTQDRFNLVKLGYCETIWLREIFAEFFGISESSIPRRNRLSKRARDKSGDPMLMSKEAREGKRIKK